MDTKPLLRANLETSMHATIGLLEDMRDAPMTRPTPNGGNHPLWVLGHLTFVDAMLTCDWLHGTPNPYESWADLFAPGSEPLDDPAAYPAYDELLSACRTFRETMLARFDALDERDLDAPARNVPEKFRSVFKTARNIYLAVGNHWFSHRGQVADARKAAGRKPLML